MAGQFKRQCRAGFISIGLLCSISAAHTRAEDDPPVAAPPVMRLFVLWVPTEQDWKAIASRTDVAVLGAYAIAQEDAFINDTALEHVPQLRNLKTLMLESSRVTDRGLAQIARARSLEAILLYDCNVSDEGLQQLSALPNLKTLGLCETRVTLDGVEAFLQKRPEVDVEIYDARTRNIFDANGCPATPFRKQHVFLPGIRTGYLRPHR